MFIAVVIVDPQMLGIGLVPALAAVDCETLGLAKEGHDHIQIVDMQVEGKQAGFVLVKEPTADSPSGGSGQTFKAGIQHLAVFFRFHQTVQMLNLLGKLKHLGNIQVAALLLSGVQHFLGIGIRKSQTARLVFTSKEGEGVAASLVDLGHRFRLIINEVDCIKTEKEMPSLPTATNFWVPKPDFYTGVEAWTIAGGAHHTAFSYDLTSKQLCDWADAMGIESVVIGKNTNIADFKRDLKLGEVYYR